MDRPRMFKAQDEFMIVEIDYPKGQDARLKFHAIAETQGEAISKAKVGAEWEDATMYVIPVKSVEETWETKPWTKFVDPAKVNETPQADGDSGLPPAVAAISKEELVEAIEGAEQTIEAGLSK